jgi:uncharacterized protein (TIGR00255 family)
MSMNSMTGFARGAGSGVGFNWNWELKSVNNKGLDVRARFPSFLDGFDIRAKKAVTGAITRGSVFIALTVESEQNSEALVVNEQRLEELLALAARYKEAEGVTSPSLDGLLAVKGVVEISAQQTSDEERKELEAVLLTSLKEVLRDLTKARGEEGARMQAVLQGQLEQIEGLAQEARALSGNRNEALLERFKGQLAKLENIDKPVPEERIAQELAVLVVKADIQEELDRLDSHIEEANTLLNSGKPVGRRLDFLCQEFNREANTLCSKSGDSKLTKIGLDLKVLVDQFREQVQNVE